MVHCFISYATPDKDLAFRLRALLEGYGLGGFIQERDGALGADWQRSIGDALESCQAVLVLATEHTGGAVYQRAEIERAINLARSAHGKPAIVPILFPGFDPAAPDSPLGLGLFHGIEIASESELTIAAARISELLGKEADVPLAQDKAYPVVQPALPIPVRDWIAAAETARQVKVIHHTRPLPMQLVKARTAFEAWWTDASAATKQRVEAKALQEALSLTARLYRMQELQSETKPTALHWADEAVRYFEQISNPELLVEALLDKAAIYLELSQIEHTDAELFHRISQDGDAVMARAASLATAAQRAGALRVWSRFFQNLARPKTGKLSDPWDNTYLFAAYEKIRKAAELEPKEMKNVTQLARVAQRVAWNAPQDVDPTWTRMLREVQTMLVTCFRESDTRLATPTERIPPLNIIAVITLDVVRREWAELRRPREHARVESLAGEMSDMALASLREALTLLPHTEWKREYDFDFQYDLSRIHGLRAAMLSELSGGRGHAEFVEAVSAMSRARHGATTTQLDAAVASIDTDPNLVLLSNEERDELRALLRGV